MKPANFTQRHIGPRESDINKMLLEIGCSSIDELIEKTIPSDIRLQRELLISDAFSEQEYLAHIKALGAKNETFKSYIGMGYYGTLVPSVILRNVLENPGWYTAYTPYQAEISQGRLEALLNFQTMVMDLTGMEMANASLLDEGTSAAEAMIMFFHKRSRSQEKAGVKKFFVADTIFPQTKDILITRAEPLNIELVFGNYDEVTLDYSFFGAMVQYPDSNGEIIDYTSFTERAHEVNAYVVAVADLMSLALLKAPGEWGADAVVGTTQRFGVPMGYGGPHAAFFACKESFKRLIPGRIIGVSVDSQGNQALRMALQTREQHIKRGKATSNICTAQALLAVMAGMYAVYHGSEGIKAIANAIHINTSRLANALSELGYNIVNANYFDTLTIATEKASVVKKIAEASKVNFAYESDVVRLSLDETITEDDLNLIISIFGEAVNKKGFIQDAEASIPSNLHRTSAILAHEVFNRYHSETEMMRYLKRLENKDFSLTHGMIPLGSCTMKLNAASELIPITWPEFANVHPFAPVNQTKGYHEIFKELDKDLSEITGFAKVSLQPNSGAQGEYAGLMVIRAYHKSRGDDHRNICIIPSSAHGTNPASAIMAGMSIVVVKCDEQGNIDISDLKEKAEQHKDNLSCVMITYPSTHGVYEAGIIEMTSIIHDNGGQVYMDGANMNAQVGLTNPGNIGADVCHLNLHKTFAIPHGGGGPGAGPIGVAKHLAEFLPGSPVIDFAGSNAITAISSAPWGSSLVYLISYGYIKMLGANGLKESTEIAILNANYIKMRLEGDFDILYTGNSNTVAHEMILDCREFKQEANIEVGDIAKRLIDYNFHAPTVSFPVAGTLMIEPTESESKEELDRFCDAMLSIRQEIREVVSGIFPKDNNVLVNAPHTAKMVISDSWNKPYSRELAAYPEAYLADNKYWVTVGRVNDAHGDRNLICSCAPIEDYIEESVV
ncbi:MAG: aminomethyl-transferring glycine dehydrogenase [Flavobacteriales bacterium]|nr:aminomethyl-transferring glycine dehydrogenase [Flavobacteriales bacterium]